MSPVSEVDEDVLFALDEPEVMFLADRASSASKARYLGWRILTNVGYVDTPFDPREITAERRFMCRFSADPFAEMTHRFCDAMTPGAELYWWVEVES